MDTTPKYILQSEKAVEIQKSWKPKTTDCFAYREYYLDDGYKKEPKHHEEYQIKTIGDIDSGRYFTNWNLGLKIVSSSYFSESWQGSVIYIATWLPRQDELQKMVGDITGFRTQINLIDSMLSHCVSEIGYGLTWEQLWLRIVMKYNHHKVWSETKKDWVYEKN